jgi:hypothetical protein
MNVSYRALLSVGLVLFFLGAANFAVGSLRLESTFQELSRIESQEVDFAEKQGNEFLNSGVVTSRTPLEEDETLSKLETKKLQLQGRLAYYRTVVLTGKTLFAVGILFGIASWIAFALKDRRSLNAMSMNSSLKEVS